MPYSRNQLILVQVLQNVSNNWAKIKEGVRKEINPFINGFVGSRKVKLAKTKIADNPCKHS